MKRPVSVPVLIALLVLGVALTLLFAWLVNGLPSGSPGSG
jgi:hypothetical protein